MSTSEAPSSQSPHAHAEGPIAALTLAALGIVFGDIGTSPLYTLNECIHGEHGAGPSPEGVLGALSLVFWSLTMVVTVKYIGFIMKADNHGEGGILALLALVPESGSKTRGITPLVFLVLVGAALLYGDGVITPAISVLSAVEGLGVATDALQKYVVPITCVILVGLFSIQRTGTGGIGKLFGPVMAVWFLTIAVLGTIQIVHAPSILRALSPTYGVAYLRDHGIKGLAILGAVVLAVTGGEALYADMGHFGARPIRISWYFLVFPALVLSYFGQGALILSSGGAVVNPFFAQVPRGPILYALVGLSTMATVIASQALISGVFSLTQQAMQLGFFPRVAVKHTSKHAEGQIYVPAINWGLMIACVLLVLKFEQSSRLAAAYGIAVSGTMGITSVCYYAVARRTWGWPMFKALPLLLLFLLFDLPFFGANLLKFVEGGYVPLGIAAVLCALMLIWHRGRRLLGERNVELSRSVDDFVAELPKQLLARLPGATIFLAGMMEGVPRSMNQYATQMHVLGEENVILTVVGEHVPFVPRKDRVSCTVIDAQAKIWRIVGHIGFMESIDVESLLALAIKRFELPIDMQKATYVIARETLLATDSGKMGAITESIFAFMLRNARSATHYFGLPPERVVELGMQIDL